MAKSIAEQLKALQSKIESQAKKSLNEAVADKVIEIGKKNVQSVVYDAYPNPTYQRTNQLRDDAWDKIPIECGVIIRNDRTENGRQISYIVESGYGYSIPDLSSPLKYGFPRPFMEVTRDMITSSDIVENIFVRELSKNLGVKCKVRK